MWVVLYGCNDSGSDGVCHDVAGQLTQVLFAAYGMIVIAALPNRAAAAEVLVNPVRTDALYPLQKLRQCSVRLQVQQPMCSGFCIACLTP